MSIPIAVRPENSYRGSLAQGTKLLLAIMLSLFDSFLYGQITYVDKRLPLPHGDYRVNLGRKSLTILTDTC